MTKYKVLLSAYIVLVIVLSHLYPVKYISVVQAAPMSAHEVLASRPVWRQLPTEFIKALATKLKSAEKAIEFAKLCETTEILKNNIVGLTDDADVDPEFAVGGVAVTLTSYANAMGEQKQFKQAKKALKLALLLRDRHLPAWISMALVAVNTGDCITAVFWADKVLVFKPDPDSKDPWESGTAKLFTAEGEKIVAEGLRDGEIIDTWKQIHDNMKAIKNVCRKRLK